MTGGRRKTVTAVLLVGLVGGMTGLAYAAVPLYRLFCQATGYGGTTQRAEAAPGAVAGRVITVRFDAGLQPGLPWRFEPAQGPMALRPGEQATAFYRAINLGEAAVIGTAVFNVTPLKAGRYFDKIQCFCFTAQRLEPGASADMPVTFFVNPALLADRNLDDVDTITLSYTFYRDKEAEARARDEAAGASSSGSRGSIVGADVPRAQPTAPERPSKIVEEGSI